MQADGLVVSTVAEPFSIPNQEFGIETPGNHGGSYHVIVAVNTRSLRNIEELPTLARKPCPELSVLVARRRIKLHTS
jgi:hypothetical protein